MVREIIRKILIESFGKEMSFNEIYCDMDGVLVDFQAGIVSKINYMLDNPDLYADSKSFLKAYNQVQKDFGSDWRLPLDFDTRSHKGVGTIQFRAIGEDPGTFFRNLPALEDGIGLLWPFINSLGKPVNILSAPISGNGPGGTADDGKRDWIRSHGLNPIETIIVPAEEKQNWAVSLEGMPNLLIDDKLKTIEQWTSRGGIGIHHIPGNSQASITKIKGYM